MYKLSVVFFLFVASSNTVCAQLRNTFIPLSTYSKSSRVIDTVQAHFRGEINGMFYEDPNEFIRKINEARMNALVKMFKNQQVVNDSMLEGHLKRMLNNILVKNRLSKKYARRVFILRSPFVNAICYGRGIYFITTALLGRVYSEDQLAFALAHEVAHDDLGHVQENIKRETKIQLAKKSNDQLRKILAGTIELEDVEEYRKLVYGVSRYSRQRETEADSLGFIFFTNAGYNPDQAKEFINVLESSQSPKYDIGAELFLPFDSELYPLQLYWFNDRLSVFSNERSSYLWQADSVLSHPVYQSRKDKLSAYAVNVPMVNSSEAMSFNEWTNVAEFQAMEDAFVYRQYDRAIYSALQLINRYPQNTYLVSRIGAMLINMFAAATPEHFSPYVPEYTDGYSNELRLVNNFLLNLTHKEIGEVAYHFLTNPNFFDSETKSHHYLLWKICELTYRFDQSHKIKKEFKSKFGENIAAFTYE